MRSKKAINNVIANLLLQGAAIIYGFIVPKIIIDYFGSDVNGLVASVTQFLAYITLLESGFGPVVKAALYKPIANKDNNVIAGILKTAENFFRKIALIFILYIIVLCFIFPSIAGTDFDTIFTVSLVIILGISTFAEYYFGMVYKLFLQAKQKAYVISIIQTVTYILAVVAVVALALLGCDILVIKLVTGLIFVIRPLMQNYYVKRKYRINLKLAPDKYPIKQKWEGLIQHIAAVIHGNTDITILTFFTTLAEVSVYSVYYLVVSGIKRVVQAFINGLDASFGDMIAKKEDDNLRKKFSVYELMYIMITTVVFTTTLLLITPFIALYTEGVSDADYYRPIFGYLLVISEFIWALRLPYSSITLAAGHFKETRKGAWAEAIINIVLSVIFVFNFGLVGVVIGTIVAMLMRTVEFVYHANKYILKRSVWLSIGKIFVSSIVMIMVFAFFQFINLFEIDGYAEWILKAIITVLITSALIILLDSLFYRKDITIIVQRMLKKKRKEGV